MEKISGPEPTAAEPEAPRDVPQPSDQAAPDLGQDTTATTADHPTDQSPLAPEADASPSRFRNLPPVDDSYPPVPDEDTRAINLNNGWRVIGASIRGLSHRHRGRYREDSIDIRYVKPTAQPTWVVTAVGDGGGSYKLSRLGSLAATRGAVSAVHAAILAQQEYFAAPTPPVSARIYDVVKGGLQAAYDAVDALPRQYPGEEVKAFSTTLLLALFGQYPDNRFVFASAQVGDGIICAFVQDEAPPAPPRLISLNTADESPYGPGTKFLHSVSPLEWPDRIQVGSLPSETSAVMLATDGVANDFYPVDKHLWRLLRHLRALVLPADDEQALAALRRELEWERDDSFDDRSLVLISAPIPLQAPTEG